MPSLGNLLCLTPRDSYVVDEPLRKRGLLGRLEKSVGPFVRSPGIGFPYLVGFLRKNGLVGPGSHVAVQHDKIEGPTPFDEILRDKIDLGLGDYDVLFVTAYTNSAREAYRRAREAKAAWAAAGRPLTVVFGGPHASAVTEEGTRRGHVDAVVAGEGEWAAAALLNDLREGRPAQPLYRATFDRIRDRGTLALDMGIWDGLKRRPQQIVASTTFARGCKLDCHFCAVFLTNGPNVRNRDVADVVDEVQGQGPRATRATIGDLPPGVYNAFLKAAVKLPLLGRLYADSLIARMGPGFSHQYFFWDDNLYNAPGSFQALCEAIRPLGRPWGAELTIDLAEKPHLLKLARESGCRDLFLGIESVSQAAIDGLDKWSNDTKSIREMVRRVHDAGINVMGAFVFGLDGDDASIFDRTLEFVYETGVDLIVANIIQPYPGTGTFKDAVAADDFLPWAACPPDSDVAMDYNWPLFDGAHVLVRPKKMTIDQLQEGYYSFLREAYSMTGILRRYRGAAWDVPGALQHVSKNWLVSRYGMIKTAHALRRKGTAPVGLVAPPEVVADGGTIANGTPAPVARKVGRKRSPAAVRRPPRVTVLSRLLAPRAPEAE
ncbi:MAG TPA: cobalamin-dependent protein [Candidatus Polarisedimenticolia bacterium]|nr:cobalamin-dependent protein [Candidatus Polarisedimenticolia bacterium]